MSKWKRSSGYPPYDEDRYLGVEFRNGNLATISKDWRWSWADTGSPNDILWWIDREDLDKDIRWLPPARRETGETK